MNTRLAARYTAIAGVLLRPLQFLLYFLSGFTPRSSRKWAFGSWSGHRYGDNAAALFEQVALQGPAIGITVIWITREPAIVAMLRARGCRAHLAWSPGGIWHCATAGVFVFDGLTRDVNHWISRGARRVLLRHGVGIKKIERGIENPSHRLWQLFHGSLAQRAFWSVLLPWHLVRPDLVIASSPDHARQGELYHGVGPEQVAVTGLPRNDQIIAPSQPAPWDPGTRAWLDHARGSGRRVFLYLPTFREGTGIPFDWAELGAVAEAAGVALAVKLHHVDANRHQGAAAASSPHLRLLDPALDANRLFQDVDGLISDYSSATYDFMLTRKPVVFFVPDLEAYERQRGLYYRFEDVTPGPRPRTMSELQDALGALARGAWTPDPGYMRVLGRFHEYLDADSCHRAFREILVRFVSSPAMLPASARKGA